MYEFTDHRHRVSFEGDVKVAALPTMPEGEPKKKALRKKLARHVGQIAARQEVLYAADTHALLVVFQGMDASGKDSAIRSVFSGVNPAGCKVTSFKGPSSLELDHDYLWRHQLALPGRGMIGVFNRSHYEEVLIAKVHPELLKRSRLVGRRFPAGVWDNRYRAIRDWERHLADNGTVILKFFLHMSEDRQRVRLLSRLDNPHKHWKFDLGDVRERALWGEYQAAYESALSETSRPWAPWYAVPADRKPYARAAIAEVIDATLTRLGLNYPVVTDAQRQELLKARATLAACSDEA